MSKAQNRHDTKKWKVKRKDHDGDRCHNAKCGICSAHKKAPKGHGKTQKKINPNIVNTLYDKEIYNDEQDELVNNFNQENQY